jgi:hypothetical protein
MRRANAGIMGGLAAGLALSLVMDLGRRAGVLHKTLAENAEDWVDRAADTRLTEVSTEAMNLFLVQFQQRLALHEHAVMTLEQAGWHGPKALQVPLPPYSPELNPVERLWLYLRERHLSHRLLDDYDAIVEAYCDARTA